MLHRVVVTGAGVISPYGTGLELFTRSLLEGQSALKYSEKLGFVVGAIADSGVDLSRWNAGQQREMSRCSLLSLLAAEEALQTAGGSITVQITLRLVNIGACMTDLEQIGAVAEYIQKGELRKISPYFVPRILNNLPAGYVAMKYKMLGGVESTSTACATGVHCIGNAFRAVRHGYARRALAGSAEACINAISLAGFNRMRALAPGKEPYISRPFDNKRNGFVLSEGVGLVLLERLEDAKERRANILAEILGYGISSDAYHISAPDPSAIGAALSMRRAIEDAHLKPDDINYVNAHATSTPAGDSVEADAIRQVFPSTSRSPLPVSSIKGHVGHLLGAAGSVETIATIACLRERKLPANLNLEQSDLGSDLNLLKKTIDWAPENTSKRIGIVNSFGFGATNASIIVGEI